MQPSSGNPPNGTVPIPFWGGMRANCPGYTITTMQFPQYHLSNFTLPFKPDLYPSGEQIMRYLTAVLEHLQLDIQLRNEVMNMKEQSGGWLLQYKNQGEL